MHGQRKISQGGNFRAKIHDGLLDDMSNNSPFFHLLGYEYKNVLSAEYSPVAGGWS